MGQRSAVALRRIRDRVELTGRLSDGLLRVGPFGLGLDGLLSWIPGLGEVYGGLAGGFLIIEGARAGVAPSRLVAAATIMALRTSVAAVPVIGPLSAELFRAHFWSARMIVRAIDRKLAALQATAP